MRRLINTSYVDFGALSERSLTRRAFIALLASTGVVATTTIATGSTGLVPLNDETVLIVVGILQPASIDSVRQFVKRALPEISDRLDEDYLGLTFQRLGNSGLILQIVSEPVPLFSLTASGNALLPRHAQVLRDKARLFLIRGKARSILDASRGSGVSADGEPPSSWIRARIEDFADRPGATSFLQGSGRSADQRSGKRPLLRETLPELLSFSNLDQVNAALGIARASKPLSFEGLALCLGVSTALLNWFIEHPDKSYREFRIPKSGGGTRLIESPRVFLKITQRLILDFFLSKLKVHDAVFSFRAGRSPATNAIQHEDKKFVGGMDIRNYFGSITLGMITKCLVENDFESEFAKKCGLLLTRRNAIPQGAPTSPILSNALLFAFDERMSQLCTAKQLTYTRYADDISFSGSDRSAIEEALEIAKAQLQMNYGLTINEKKTRLVENSRQQRVTGAVVNKAAVPPRKWRRKVRAIFHEADRNPAEFTKELSRLRGYLGYLGSFPSLRNSREISRYRSIIDRVRRA